MTCRNSRFFSIFVPKIMTTELYHNICDYLRNLIAGTEWEGAVYAVGGCCRDELMNLPIKDVDLAVNRPDGGVRFGRWLYEQGLTVDVPTEFVKYGTAKLNLTEFPDDEIELVQTRREKYTDRTSRNPETAFGSIEEDCVRRDLTINSIYYDITNRTFIDITNRGIDDIKNQIIRTPNDPDVTYDDDPVRILRCIRFATRFGWNIDQETYAAMIRNVNRMNIVSVERIRGELEKILLCDMPSVGLELLRQTGAMNFVIPELEKTYSLDQNHRHCGSVWEHTLKVVDQVPADIQLRMAALLHDIGKTTSRVTGSDGEVHYPRHERTGRLVNKILRHLRYRSDFIKKVEFLVVNHMVTKHWGDRVDVTRVPDIRRIQYKCTTRRRFNDLLALIDADNKSMAPEYCMPHQISDIVTLSDSLMSDKTDMFGYHLPISPSEIAKIKNIRNEKQIRKCVEFLLDKAFHNPRLTKSDMKKLLETFTPPEPKKKHRRRFLKAGGGKKRKDKKNKNSIGQ